MIRNPILLPCCQMQAMPTIMYDTPARYVSKACRLSRRGACTQEKERIVMDAQRAKQEEAAAAQRKKEAAAALMRSVCPTASPCWQPFCAPCPAIWCCGTVLVQHMTQVEVPCPASCGVCTGPPKGHCTTQRHCTEDGGGLVWNMEPCQEAISIHITRKALHADRRMPCRWQLPTQSFWSARRRTRRSRRPKTGASRPISLTRLLGTRCADMHALEEHAAAKGFGSCLGICVICGQSRA